MCVCVKLGTNHFVPTFRSRSRIHTQTSRYPVSKFIHVAPSYQPGLSNKQAIQPIYQWTITVMESCDFCLSRSRPSMYDGSASIGSPLFHLSLSPPPLPPLFFFVLFWTTCTIASIDPEIRRGHFYPNEQHLVSYFI